MTKTNSTLFFYNLFVWRLWQKYRFHNKMLHVIAVPHTIILFEDLITDSTIFHTLYLSGNFVNNYSFYNKMLHLQYLIQYTPDWGCHHHAETIEEIQYTLKNIRFWNRWINNMEWSLNICESFVSEFIGKCLYMIGC